MSRTEQQFFALLRAGLWNSPIEETLFTDNNTDWLTLLKMAAKQTALPEKRTTQKNRVKPTPILRSTRD